MDMDYGHEKYLDVLQGQKATIAKALERLERRTAEVLYKTEKWFEWVQGCQMEEEQNREKEQKKVKMEAALWKRHWKATEQRMREHRAKEDKQRQDAFLEKVYKERLAERDAEDESDIDWDPIEGVLEDSRGNYIDAPSNNANPAATTTPSKQSAKAPSVSQSTPTTSSRKSKKKKSSNSTGNVEPVTPKTQDQAPDKSLIETKEEMVNRLKFGTQYNRTKSRGLMIAGTVENPVMELKTVTFPEDEIERLLQEVYEIKQLLFCRLLLSHAALLPAALRAKSVEEFLSDEEVTPAALRDLCLKMESPGLQEIRDACADLFRADEEEDDEPKPVKPESPKDELAYLNGWGGKRPGALPDKWISKRDKIAAKKEERAASGKGTSVDEALGTMGGGMIDFGQSEQETLEQQKIKVNICGRSIWNYPSSKAMTRKGWLQFCIIAKDSRLEDAIALCRHWDEFYELNILACWHYFPGANWADFVGSRPRQQMLQLGFITYYESDSPDAMELTVRHTQGGRRGQNRRAHAMFEARNIMCAHIKRDDQLLYKAHRCRVGKDLYNSEAEILKTLCRPEDSERVKDIRPGEDTISIWEQMNSMQTQFFYGEVEDITRQQEELERRKAEFQLSIANGAEPPEPTNPFPRSLFYNDADALEDAILFPEELQQKTLDPSLIGKISPIKAWEDDGFALKNFVRGLDLVDSDLETETEDDGESWQTESSEDEYELDAWTANGSDEDGDHEKCKHEESTTSDDDGKEISDELLDKLLPAGYMDLMKKCMAKPRDKRDLGDHDRMDDDFMTYLDKEKARIFKEVWHKADLEPLAQERYIEMLDMVKTFRKWGRRSEKSMTNEKSFIHLTIMAEMEVVREDSKDAQKAIAKVMPFFRSDFLKSEMGAKFKDSLMFNQSERAKHVPDCRTSTSTMYRSAKFWQPFEEAEDKMKHEEDMEALPEEWDLKTRPIIAHLYKAGVIRTRPDEYYSGQVTCTTEPSRPNTLDMFIDYRHQMDNITMGSHMQNPYLIPSFKTTAAAFQAKHPEARFSVLRLWSAPHFYPLMIGPHNHDATSFRDILGRRFIWMFIPKDMPCSEWSMHHTIRLRVEPHEAYFNGRVKIKRDKLLVMGETEDECLKLTCAAVMAVQMRPWRMEIDVWKSFFGVERGFVEGLDEAWLS
ncbi:hypothetical protein M7I_7276 [Glarea lozoyensis 74030]|uniref:Uncharacterized protein n=1 Tax=Glarea lozoyensis (strain ATCC 74030 / MF5533) TaxID=1104152 RepID=H0EWV2_GLAL7|nr:hypothetical protein M7I_7276 [Glarea lozoyensis 74030]